MAGPRRGLASLLIWLVLLGGFWPAKASDDSFPFGSELILDAAPMPGTKRIPILQIDESGAATIDLWCVSTRAQVTVGDDTIVFNTDPAPQTQCTPALQSADEDLLVALAQMTNWRRNGDLIALIGTAMLRFHLMTN